MHSAADRATRTRRGKGRKGRKARPTACRPFAVGALACTTLLLGAATSRAELLYLTEGNNLRRLDLASIDEGAIRSEVFIEHATRAETGSGPSSLDDARRRDINGMVCALPDGSGGFVAGEDTGQPSPPPGWGVFERGGSQIGKLVPTYFVEQAEPYGCAFDAEGRLFTSSLGNVGFGSPKGQLILWWPPFHGFPGEPGAFPRTDATTKRYCKLAVDIGNAMGVAIDAQGRVHVASSGRGAIYRFSPPFPTGPDAAGGCGKVDEQGSPLASPVERDTFFSGLYTFSGLAFAPNGNLYAASVFTGEILELGADGSLLRKVLEPHGLLPPFATGTPMGLAVDAHGRLYYADIDLRWDFPSIGPGPNGKLRMIRFDANGDAQAPETLIEGLAFPDGLGIAPGSLASPADRAGTASSADDARSAR